MRNYIAVLKLYAPTTHYTQVHTFLLLWVRGEQINIYVQHCVHGELLLLPGTGAGTRQSTGGGYYHITAHTSSRVHPEKSEDIS